MPLSDVAKRKRLIQPWSLAFLVIMIVVVLFLLMPRGSLFDRLNTIGKADALTVEYLHALLETDTKNDEVRLLYAEHLVAIGDINEASEQLKKFHMTSGYLMARRMILKLRISTLRQLKDIKNNTLRQQSMMILENFLTLPIRTFSIKQWTEMASLMLQVGQPSSAAKIYMRLGRLDKEHQSTWLREAAKWFLVSGNAKRASRVQLRIAGMTGTFNDAKSSIDFLLAASQQKKVMQIIPDMIRRFPKSRYLLKKGMQVALFTKNTTLAVTWGEKWLSTHPDDAFIMQKLISLELAAENPKKALVWAKEILKTAPDSTKLHYQLANISQWGGDYKGSYRQWLWLIKYEPSLYALKRAIWFAHLLRDYPAEKTLLSQAMAEYAMPKETLMRLAKLQEKLGEPEASEKSRVAYLKKSPENQAVWEDLAILREYLGHMKESEATWREIEKRFGTTETTVIHRAKMLTAMGKEEDGLRIMRDYAQLKRPAHAHFWKLYGWLAWALEYHGDAYQAYTWLWENKYANLLDTQGLISLLNEAGKVKDVLRISREAWKRFKSPGVLLIGIESAMQINHWLDVEDLMAQTAKHLPMFRGNVRYWLVHARWMQHKHDFIAAENDFSHALKLQPGNEEARISLLWFWIDTKKYKPLHYFLKLWKNDAIGKKRYWRAYAAAYRSMGKNTAALYWFQKSIKATPDDMLWMLEYADTLADTGQASGAWRLRQHLFRKMWPNSRLSSAYAKKNSVALLEAQAGLRKQLLGRPYAEAWVKPFLQHTEDPLVREFAIRWFFGAGDESQAEFWLMHQHAKRLETPVWQNLALAMERNDQDSIYRIISEHSNKIDHMSKILAVRQLGRLDDTWVLAMDTQLGTHHFNAIERTTMLRYARNIASESPNAAHLSLKFDDLGSLALNRVYSRAYYSRGNHTIALEAGKTLLSSNTSLVNFGGSNQEYDATIQETYRYLHGDVFSYIGVNRRNAGVLNGRGFIQWGGGMHWRPWQGGEVGLRLDVNQLDVETPGFRLIGKKDLLTLSFSSDMTTREYFSSNVKLNRYYTRNNEALARGYIIEGVLGHRLGLTNSLGEEQMQLNLNGLFMRNSLQAKLGSFAQQFLPGTAVETVMPAKFSSLSLNFNLQKDVLDNNEAVGRSLSYLMNTGVGWQWPTSTLTYNLSLGIGLPIMGRDMLSFRSYMSSTAIGGGTQYGLLLSYAGRFDR